MKDFRRWFQQQALPGAPVVTDVSELPEGVWDRDGGKYFSRCRSCDKSFEIELDGFNPDFSYCGRSPRCLP